MLFHPQVKLLATWNPYNDPSLESVLQGDRKQTHMQRYAERQTLLGEELTPGQTVCAPPLVLNEKKMKQGKNDGTKIALVAT